jgi:uncharacterized protein YjdB
VTFTWTSADQNVATVDNEGRVAAVNVGSTTVTVSSGSVKTDIPVTVLTDEVPLVSIGVDQTTVSLPVDDSVTIVTTKAPVNATGVEFTWTSANPEIATVDATGKIKIVGVGETTVTVSFGSVKTEISVIGIIKKLTIVDASGESNGNAVLGDKVQLSVIIEPANTGLTPDSWSSNDDNIATVSQTGLVTVTGSGYATISAVVNGITATYTVATQSAFDDALGYWRFDDPQDLGKATKGTDLFVYGTVTSVDGPSETNLAVEGTRGEQNLKWEHQQNPDPDAFTMMWDMRVYSIRQYYCLYWNSIDGDGSFFARWRIEDYKDPVTEEVVALQRPLLSVGRGSYWPLMEIPEGDTSNWIRLVITFTFPDRTAGAGFYNAYVDGVLTVSNKGCTPALLWNPDRLEEIPPLYFLSDGGIGGGDGDDAPHPVAAIAVWDKILTDQEIAALGKVK